MNEVLKNSFEIERDPQFDIDVFNKKIELLNHLVTDDDNVDWISQIQLLAATPSDKQPVLTSTLNQLIAAGVLNVEHFASPSNNTFICYTLTNKIPATAEFASPSGPAVDKTLHVLREHAWNSGDINTLSNEEWCLMYILENVSAGMKVGDQEIDLKALHKYMLEYFGDEGIEKWHQAFAGAVEQAKVIFSKRT